MYAYPIGHIATRRIGEACAVLSPSMRHSAYILGALEGGDTRRVSSEIRSGETGTQDPTAYCTRGFKFIYILYELNRRRGPMVLVKGLDKKFSDVLGVQLIAA